MPEIHDLLADAAPAPRPYDEDDIRRRVAVRSRRRRVGVALAAAVLVAGVSGIVLSLTGDDDVPVRVANDPEEPTAPPAVSAAPIATALSLVHDQIWIGGDGFVSLGDGSGRIEVPGAVVGLATGDLLWAAGDTWVAAIDPIAGSLLGTWDGARIGDIQPLEDRQVAISQPDEGEIVIVRGAAAGVEEVSRISVGPEPTDLVVTIGNELWVRDRDVICRIDVGAGAVVDDAAWSGPLLGPSLSGGIWTVQGPGVIDLHPENLDVGVSVAEGERYNTTATFAVETEWGLYIGGPAGVSRHDVKHIAAEIIDTDEPTALVATGGQLAYLVDGKVRTAMAEGPVPTDEELQGERNLVAARFLSDELGWPDAVFENVEETLGVARATSNALPGRSADVILEQRDREWVVVGLYTLDHGDRTGRIRLGTGAGEDHVDLPYAEDGLTAELLVRYGDKEVRRTAEPGAAPDWTGDLGWVAEAPGWIQVLYRNADGIAVEGWAQELGPGPVSLEMG